jgi:hypothetical protein
MTPHDAILRTAGLIVPRCRRAEWLADWRSELWYVMRARRPREVLVFSLGAFQDAIWLRRSHPRAAGRLQSPLACLALLTLFAALSALFFFHGPQAGRGPVLAHVLIFFIAIVILPATMTVTCAEYPRNLRRRRWTFTVVKFVLVLPIVYFGSLDLAPLVSAGGVQPHAMLIGYVIGFRWVLLDQRRRCPVCLRRLANPCRIGRCSQTFLEWYGTELFCPKGHGLLHEPEITASYATRQWLNLDPSWSGLFW